MRIIKPSHEILSPIDGEQILKHIELCGRVCYKSEDRITDNSANKFVASIIKRGHESVLEHVSITVKFICDRGVSHEIVRHRIASYSQESTRYVSSCDINFDDLTEEDCISLYQDGFSMKRIANCSKGKFTEWQVNKILMSSSVPKRNLGSRGIVKHDYFSSIDTPEKAYLLGFIYADGSIRNTLDQLMISQKEENQWFLLNMLRDFIQPDAKSLQVAGKEFVAHLIDKGVVPNKTYDISQENTEKLWESIYEYRYDFLRGFLDGDGNIRWFYQKETSNTQSCNITFSSTNLLLLKKIVTMLENEYNYSPNIREDYKEGKTPFYRLAITDSSIGTLFCENLYKNFVFPYGHPKTARFFEAFEMPVPTKLHNCTVAKDFNVIKPIFFNGSSLWQWGRAMMDCEISYNKLIASGATPQEARSVLPNSIKTELICTMNLREWRHFFKLRTAKAAHPQMREIAIPLLAELKEKIPVVFDDIEVEV
ncbi:FAD-dependent thymidylate synthase [Bacteroides sp.]|uniref:FAD-dependent thymidylate synthase n=1 Tax=Bacteroides sp. TaxID=29523 RepID=UPI0026363442|nr:FAD-dependent thymidylate synthase [Bacteroides sp.]